jgi:hypothetical protein
MHARACPSSLCRRPLRLLTALLLAALQIIAHINVQRNGFRRVFEITCGDSVPFHVTNCLTTCANGSILPSVLIHSRPGCGKGKGKDKRKRRGKASVLSVSLTELDGICDSDGKNPTGTGVLVTTNGSMEREVFGEWARHFVAQLGTGKWTNYGPGGFGVLLLLDGHASRWSYEARRRPRAHAT